MCRCSGEGAETMKQTYRGHEISVTRERCLGGWDMLYYSVYRLSDGYCCVENFEDSDERVPDMVRHMRERIDAELAEDDPWMEGAGR